MSWDRFGYPCQSRVRMRPGRWREVSPISWTTMYCPDFAMPTLLCSPSSVVPLAVENPLSSTGSSARR